LSLNTPDDESYYALKSVELQRLDYANGMFYKTFKFKGKSNAHISLFANSLNIAGDPVKVNNQIYYEIVLGGWSNTKSAIRQKGSDQNKMYALTEGAVVDPENFKTFTVAVKDGSVLVSFGSQPGENVFMQLELPEEIESYLRWFNWLGVKPFKPRYFAVMTGWGSTGEWVFES